MTNNLAKLTKYFISFIFDDLKNNPMSLAKSQHIKSDLWKISGEYILATNDFKISIFDLQKKSTLIDFAISYESINTTKDIFIQIMDAVRGVANEYDEIANSFNDVLAEGI